MPLKKREAAAAAATTATTLQSSAYLPPDRSSSRICGTALGWLLLYLLGRDLPRRETQTGWALAERWLEEIVVSHDHRRVP